MLSLSLLGRPLLSADGSGLQLAVRKTWGLLVLLAVAGSAPRPRIASLLWPTLDLATARRNLRRELARLSESGAGGLLRAEGDFLALDPAVDLDLRHFERACAEQRHEDALALWRGPLADGLQIEDAEGFDDWLNAERERQRERWRQALEAAAQSGAPERAVERLQTLLADDPLQERHHRALIRHHLAAGQREAALAQYERCRALLADELGLAPMAETDALLDGLRRTVLPPPPRLRMPGLLPFVGRHGEVQQLEAAWPARGLWWIEGEGGVGKSRLASDFCAAHGAYALARCRPGDDAAPYAAFTRALRVLSADALATAELPGWVASELARVMPELGPQPPPMAAAEERARFHEACAQAWRVLGDDSFDAIVVDDWHLADEASAALLGFIVQRLGPDSPRLLLVARPLPVPAPLAEAAALRLRLEPLAADDVAELVRQLSHVPEPRRFAERLLRATGGNPFFIAETLRHLAETGVLQLDAQGRWATAHDADTVDYRELPLPASVRDAVLARVQRLPDAPRRLLEAASLAGEPFAPALLAAACALSEVEALSAIEQALAATLLREHDDGGYGFTHDLARQALEASLPPDRRRLVHRRLALAAEATNAAPGLTAHHFEAGGEPARALPYRIQAGDEAQRLFAGAQALQHWQAALDLGPAPTLAAQLRLRCASACVDLGDGAGALAQVALIDAHWAAGELDAEQGVAAQIECARLEAELNQSDRALPRIEALLARLPEGAQRARALRVQSLALQNLGRLDEAQERAHAALAQWPEPGHASERAELFDILNQIEYQRSQPQRALEAARQARALWLASADRRGIQRAHQRFGVLLLIDGDADGGAAELREARRMAAELHLVDAEREAIVNLLKVHADRGEGQAMLALAQEAWNLSPRFSRPRLRLILLQAQCFAYGLLGELGRCLTLAEQFLAESAASGEPVARQYAVLTVLDLLIYTGDFERGRALLRELQEMETKQLLHYGLKLALNRAYLEYKAGDLVAARAALAELGDASALQEFQDRATLALRQAELLLAEGDAAASLAVLEPWREGLPHVELVVMAWTQRLRAQQALGAVDAADWAAARAVLDDAQLPPTEALELRRVLWRSAPAGMPVQDLKRSIDAEVARLAASLESHPRAQADFMARHAG